MKKSEQTFYPSKFPNIQKPSVALIQLVYKRNVLVSKFVFDFIYANGGYFIKVAVLKPVSNDIFYRPENMLLAYIKTFSRFLPGHFPCPFRKKDPEGIS